jgi:hypothetical protein
LNEDSDKPFFSEVIQNGGSSSNLNSFHEPETEGFPGGTGKSMFVFYAFMLWSIVK